MTPGDRGLEGPQASAPRAEPERPDWSVGGEEAGREGAKEGGGLASWSRQAAGARASLVESASPQRRRTQPEHIQVTELHPSALTGQDSLERQIWKSQHGNQRSLASFRDGEAASLLPSSVTAIIKKEPHQHGG